ncbi:hypothetical protein C0J52_01731 [Blattella germanica]|nr:hypothetical protein C0J52_01731 [Blattella germanica]
MVLAALVSAGGGRRRAAQSRDVSAREECVEVSCAVAGQAMAPRSIFVYLLPVLVMILSVDSETATTLRTCEPIRVDMCMGLGYNVTGMPNLVGHELQGDADFTLQTFNPLIQYGCSAQLHFFLCSVYVPMCTEKVATPIGPCRGLCESVRARCYPVLQGFGFTWPAALNCSKFPLLNNHEHMCMEGPGEVGVAPRTGLVSSDVATPAISRISTVSRTPNVAPCSRYVRHTKYVYENRTKRCTPLCDADILFEDSDKYLAEVCLSVCAALCFISTLVAVLTFLVDSGGGQAKFRYPERPLAFLALCYNLASVGWGVRAAAGRTAVACSHDTQNPTRLLLSYDGHINANCAVVFLLLYYFGTAACVW